MINKLVIYLVLCLSFNPINADTNQKNDDHEIRNLYSSISNSLDDNEEHLVYKHLFKSFSEQNSLLTLDDGMTFTIGWWYQSIPKNWKKGDRIFITYDFTSGQYKLEHDILNEVVWASFKSPPYLRTTIKAILNHPGSADAYSKATLDNKYVFRSIFDKAFNGWKEKDRIIILANPSGNYQLWNTENSEIIKAKLVDKIVQKSTVPIVINDILGLENRLNDKVLQQPEATKALMTSLLNYTAGLKELEKPIGVFLFIGPTGVGKTELAKVLTSEIYKDPSKILRFDMSHFTEPHSISRLIGSAPGYVNHEEGGQLTGPLLKNSQTVVLLDELEKAHPQILKAFLPVFDEGFILDTKNNRISCADTIFIMTSNLCGKEITELYNLGYSQEHILQVIEPYLMESLSPELYNRVEPVLFRPLAKETMGALVDLMLVKVKERLLVEKKISIQIDDSLKSFLAENGYHPLLGARPLKKLIEKRVLNALAYSIIKKEYGSGSDLILLYEKETDSVHVHCK